MWRTYPSGPPRNTVKHPTWCAFPYEPHPHPIPNSRSSTCHPVYLWTLQHGHSQSRSSVPMFCSELVGAPCHCLRHTTTRAHAVDQRPLCSNASSTAIAGTDSPGYFRSTRDNPYSKYAALGSMMEQDKNEVGYTNFRPALPNLFLPDRLCGFCPMLSGASCVYSSMHVSIALYSLINSLTFFFMVPASIFGKTTTNWVQSLFLHRYSNYTITPLTHLILKSYAFTAIVLSDRGFLVVSWVAMYSRSSLTPLADSLNATSVFTLVFSSTFGYRQLR